MRNRILTGLTLLLLLFAVAACNLSELPALVRENLESDETMSSVANGTTTPDVVVVVATPGPESSSPASGIDVEEQRVIDVYRRVSPAVVCITASEQFGECIGSGFIIDAEGHIVTNNHVAIAADELLVTLADDHTVPASVVGADPGSDLAVLDIDVPVEELTLVELGDSASLQVGQRAIAIGNPFGLERTITTGIISSLGRTLNRDDSDFQLAEVIQTDAAINPGNSGGPLLDSWGRVIGVNSAIASTSGSNSGVGFAIPVDIVKRVVPDLIATGSYRHTWLGVTGSSLIPEIVEAGELPVDNGVLLYEVEPGSPADKAGLQGGNRQVLVSNLPILVGGDIIVAINGQEVSRFDDVVNFLAGSTSVGDVITLTIVRGDQTIEVDVTLEARPSDR